MPAQLLAEFPEKTPKSSTYVPLFDGQTWKVSPTDYDYDVEDIKAFVSSLKNAAAKAKLYIRVVVTLDNHVILQRRPLGYVPKVGGRPKREAVEAP